MKVLLVEDHEHLAAILQEALVSQHYVVEMAADGEEGWQLVEAFEYDVILLDWMLPRLDGIAFLKRLRGEESYRWPSLNRRTPVLLMTAQVESADKVTGLDAGADDYLVKPFDINELLARIRALLRRGSQERSPLVSWRELELNPTTCQVHYQSQQLHLTAKEYGLMELFLRYPQRIFSYSALIEHLWQVEEIPTENAIRAHIKSLRKKLKEVGAQDFIETVYGLGYRLKSETKPKPTPKTKPNQALSIPVQSVWEKYRDSYQSRLDTIEQAIAAGLENRLTPQLQHKAQHEAHTLIGSLGIFGLDDASQLCREIEQTLKPQTIAPAPAIAALALKVQQLHHLITSIDFTPLNPLPLTAPDPKQIVIVDSDPTFTDSIQQAAIAYNFQLEIVTNLQQADSSLLHTSHALLLDLTTTITTSAGLAFLEQLSTRYPTLPVLVITAQDDFAMRVKIAQLGGKGFLQRPIAPLQVLEAIAQSLTHTAPATAKLLIVDDDSQALDALRSILNPWGFQLILLSDPQQFWHTLEQTQPDLLILDIEMPTHNGIDLCQVVRNDLRWGDLPILFLSAHTDDQTLQRAFMVGADDYISKPVRPTELVARILRPLERAKLRQELQRLKNQL